MHSRLVGCCEVVFVVHEVPHMVGEPHIDDCSGHCQVDFFLQAHPDAACIDVKGLELREVGLDVCLVFQFPKSSLGICALLSVAVFRLQVCGI